MDKKKYSIIEQYARKQAVTAVKSFENTLLESCAPTERLNPQIVFRPKHHLEPLVFSPDGSVLAGVCGKSVYLWDCQNMQVFQIFENATSTSPLVFSPDGKTILFCGSDFGIKMYDIFSGELQHTLVGHKSFLDNIAISPDGNTLISTSSYEKTRIWDMFQKECVFVMPHRHSDVVISPDGKTYFLCSSDTIEQYDLKTHEKLNEFIEKRYSNSHHRMVITPDGQTIITGSVYDHILRVLDLKTGNFRQIKPPGYSPGGTKALSISRDGKSLMVCNYHTALSILDLASGYCIENFPGNSGAIVFSRDGKFSAANQLSSSEALKFYSLQNGSSLLHHAPDGDYLTTAEISPDGKTLLTDTDDHSLTLWDLSNGKPAHKLTGHREFVDSAVFSPTGKLLASGGQDKTIRLWDTKSGQCLQRIPTRENIRCLVFSPNERYLAASLGKKINIYEIKSGNIVQTFQHEKTSFNKLQFTLDSRQLYCISIGYNQSDRNIYLWDIQTGACEIPARIKVDSFRSVLRAAFHLEKNRLLSASEDKKICVQNLQTGELLHTLSGHEIRIGALIFHPDGERCISADDRNTVVEWDIVKGTRLRTFEGHPSSVYWDDIRELLISPDRKLLIAAGFDSRLTYWDYQSGEVLATMYNLNKGYLWTTPPDEMAPHGWLHTDRHDLISLTSLNEDNHVNEHIPKSDDRFNQFMQMFNDENMVMNRIHDRERFDDLLKLRSGNRANMVNQLLQESRSQSKPLLPPP